MALLSDWGFFVKPEKTAEFEEWLAANEARFIDAAPPTYEYVGTFRPLWKTNGGQQPYHQVWRYLSEAPPDLRTAAKDSHGDFTDLAREYLDFVDQSRSDDEDFRLYRSAVMD